jgi:hypothetical protein
MGAGVAAPATGHSKEAMAASATELRIVKINSFQNVPHQGWQSG